MLKMKHWIPVTLLVLILSLGAGAELLLMDNFDDSDTSFTRSTIDNQIPNGDLGGFWDTRATDSGQAKLETRDESQMLSVETVSFGDGRGCAFGGVTDVIDDSETGVLFFRFLSASNQSNPVGTYVGFHDKPVDDTEPLSPAAANNANNLDQIVAGFAMINNGSAADDPYNLTTIDRLAVIKSDLVRDQWYNAWIVADNSADTYDVYISEAGDPAGPATLPTSADLVGIALPFNRATHEPLTGCAFFTSLVPGTGLDRPGVRAPKTYFDEIWWSGSGGVEPATSATSPNPGNGARGVLRDGVTLVWNPGEYAKTHNVFVGDSYEDVNNATVENPLGIDIHPGLTDSSLSLPYVDYGTTYYWRVDEIDTSNSASPLPDSGRLFTASVLHDQIHHIRISRSHLNQIRELILRIGVTAPGQSCSSDGIARVTSEKVVLGVKPLPYTPVLLN
ncbi:hypothetical protein ACFL6U_30075 [Planctomycetota bacterium]